MPMSFRHALAALTLLLSGVFAGAATAQTLAAPLATRTLADRPLVIPDDLPERPSLLIAGFSPDSATQTAHWRRRLAQEEGLRGLVEVYQIAILQSVPRLLRGMVISGIRRDVPPSQHERFLVVTRDEAAWKALTSYTDPDAAYLVLMAGGQVLWRSEGAYSDAAMRALHAALAGSADVP